MLLSSDSTESIITFQSTKYSSNTVSKKTNEHFREIYRLPENDATEKYSVSTILLSSQNGDKLKPNLESDLKIKKSINI